MFFFLKNSSYHFDTARIYWKIKKRVDVIERKPQYIASEV
jgi:hypothetical protein